MKKPDTLGQFEQLVVTAVVLLREQAYGMAVHAKVEELGDRPVKLPAVYVTLDRLEEKGYLSSRLTVPTTGRRRVKRCYRLQTLGERALEESAATAKRVYEALEESWRFGKWRPGRAKFPRSP